MTSPVSIELLDGIAVRRQPGDGERILWIHGYTMDSSTWGEFWQLMPECYHVALDLPSHGNSRPLQPGENLERLALALCELAENEGVRHLVAISFGTIVAIEMAIRRPEMFSSLTLGAPALSGGPQDPEIEARYQELFRLYRRSGPGTYMTRRWMTSPPNIFKGAEAQPRLFAQLFEVIERHRWTELANGGMMALTLSPQTTGELRKIRARTLVLIGDGELPAFKYCAYLLCRSIPDCRGAVVSGVGHLCLLEAPHATAPLIMRHIREAASESPSS